MNSTDVHIEENGPRDGLQNEKGAFTLQERVHLIDHLSRCGFPRIQVGSFVDPRRVPQMAHTDKLFQLIHRNPHVTYSALILNRHGLQRAVDCGVEHLSTFASASEAHSLKNNNCSVEKGTERVVSLITDCRERGVRVQAGVMSVFGCQTEGAIPIDRVLAMVSRFLEAGAEEINLADTSGFANPRQLKEVLLEVQGICSLPLRLHLHDTYGFGMANIYAAWEMGIRRFDTSCGGLGGCPFIPRASGNLPTEDVVHFFEAMGCSTGIDLGELVTVVAGLETKLGRTLPGRFSHLPSFDVSKPACIPTR